MSVVLYRKYRPKKFKEVAGQEHVVITLTNALKQDIISHGYLFSGPHGCGKTSIATLSFPKWNKLHFFPQCLRHDKYNPLEAL